MDLDNEGRVLCGMVHHFFKGILLSLLPRSILRLIIYLHSELPSNISKKSEYTILMRNCMGRYFRKLHGILIFYT